MDAIEVLDDDILDMTGQIEIPRRGRSASAEAKRTVNGLFADPTRTVANESWWLGLEPAAFYAAAPGELERMQGSKFGRMKRNIPESPA